MAEIPGPATEPSVSYVPTPTPVSTPTPTPAKEYKYFPAPPIIQTLHQYQNVNNDKNLQDMETTYFLDKTIEYINKDKSWSKLKKFKKHLNGPDGYEIIYKLLKLFVRKGNTNWYDLKMQKYLVLDYIKHKLSKL